MEIVPRRLNHGTEWIFRSGKKGWEAKVTLNFIVPSPWALIVIVIGMLRVVLWSWCRQIKLDEIFNGVEDTIKSWSHYSPVRHTLWCDMRCDIIWDEIVTGQERNYGWMALCRLHKWERNICKDLSAEVERSRKFLEKWQKFSHGNYLVHCNSSQSISHG